MEGSKRRWNDSLEVSPEAKRLRADLLFDILDDDDDDASSREKSQTTPDLVSVMRSFEEEIGLPSPSSACDPPAVPFHCSDELQNPDLGFLLEASDDELGLPPSALSDLDVCGKSGVGTSASVAGWEEAVGFGQIWGLDDEIHGYGALDQTNGAEGREIGFDDDMTAFDGVLFECADGAAEVLSASSDSADFVWKPESLPAA